MSPRVSKREHTVLLIVPRGFAARFLLQTAIVPTLQAAGVRVVILTPNGVAPVLSAEIDADALAIEPLNVVTGPQPGGRLAQLLRSPVRIARRAAMDARRSPGIVIRYERIRAAYGASWPRWASAPFHLLITQLLWRSRYLRQLAVRADVALSRDSEHGEVFDRYDPDLVVGASLGYVSPDEPVFQEAARRGIKVAALVSGWDNPTTRGYRAADLDLVVAWSERMRAAIVDLHDVPAGRVKVGGVPHWDVYRRDGALPEKEELWSHLGLDPGRQVILFAAFTPTGNPLPFEEIAGTLTRATAGGRWVSDAQLVIRLHPKHMTPDEEASRRPYEAMAESSRSILVNYPDMADSESLSGQLTQRDAQELGGLMKHCDVLVNIFSTTTLEAFLLDRPVVMAIPEVRQDPGLGTKLAHARQWVNWTHLAPLVDSGAARIARSPEELVAHVNAYLADPSLERQKRRRVAVDECGPTDGGAGERTAGFLLEEIGVSPTAAAGRPTRSARHIAPT